jgi:hypothetical protein
MNINQLPWSRRLGSLTNFQHTEAHGDDLFVHDLVEHRSHEGGALRGVSARPVPGQPLQAKRLRYISSAQAALDICGLESTLSQYLTP